MSLIAAAGALSLVVILLSLVVVPWLIIRMQPDYFVRPPDDDASLRARHPALVLAGRLVKNAIGAVLLLAGICMIVLPGPGFLTMFASLALLDFPGKRRLEVWLVRKRSVHGSLNWIRRKAGRPALVVP